jgi:hypothetical protein
MIARRESLHVRKGSLEIRCEAMHDRSTATHSTAAVPGHFDRNKSVWFGATGCLLSITRQVAPQRL